jgi:hypothetical protein
MHDPHAWAPMVRKFAPTSYASIPVLVSGEAVGIMQADLYFSGRDVDGLDRDVAAAFVNGLGRDLERMLLLERLHAQRSAPACSTSRPRLPRRPAAARRKMRRWPS